MNIEYTIAKLLEALEMILFNTRIQFDGNIFQEMLGLSLGGWYCRFILLMAWVLIYELNSQNWC